MGKCAKRTKRIVRGIARELTPVGIRLIGEVVGIAEGTDWSNDEKRERAVEMARGALRSHSIEAREVAVRAGVEASVAALKEGADALRELGEAEPQDLDEDPAD